MSAPLAAHEHYASSSSEVISGHLDFTSAAIQHCYSHYSFVCVWRL